MAIQLVRGESFTITKPGDSSVYIGLSREEAEDLRYQLTLALGPAVGTTIPQHSPEPNLPVGSRLRDEEGDTLIRERDGWRWFVIDGEIQRGSTTQAWDRFSRERSFQVIN